MNVVPGSTDVSLSMRAMATSGTALEGKVYSDFTLWYRRDGAKVAIPTVTLAELTTAHTDGGVKEIDDGWYRVDMPDAAFAEGVDRMIIGGSVDGGVLLTIPLDLNSFATEAALADGTVQVGTILDGAIGAAAVADIFSTTAIAEAYAADGSAATPAQILYLVMQSLHEFAISGTIRTVKKLNGTTTAATFTLNSATVPTSTTRET